MASVSASRYAFGIAISCSRRLRSLALCAVLRECREQAVRVGLRPRASGVGRGLRRPCDGAGALAVYLVARVRFWCTPPARFSTPQAHPRRFSTPQVGRWQRTVHRKAVRGLIYTASPAAARPDTPQGPVRQDWHTRLPMRARTMRAKCPMWHPGARTSGRPARASSSGIH